LASAKPPIGLLVLITISGTLAMHMFVPALPFAAKTLGAGTAAMQLTISVYIAGLAFGQLLYGPLSDALGRKPMLLLGLAVYTLAGLVAAIAPNVHVLVIARLFQALGGCAGLALGRAIVRDTASGEEAVRDLALLNLMITIGPGLAPLLGSGLSEAFGWRSIFLFLSALGCFTVVLTWKNLRETGTATQRMDLRSLVGDYLSLLRSHRFMGISIGGGCATTSMYAFIATAPFILTADLHRSLHEVGYSLGLVVAGAALGSALTRYLSHVDKPDRILWAANVLSVASSLLLLVVVATDAMTLWNVLGLMFLFAVGAGVASPLSLSLALHATDARQTGSAAGLYGFLQMAVGAICTLALGLFADPALAMACVLFAAASFSLCANRYCASLQQSR
jgi:DHA1 family bicyclomycin/chloramphenicol resistance-like MFS transporter